MTDEQEVVDRIIAEAAQPQPEIAHLPALTDKEFAVVMNATLWVVMLSWADVLLAESDDEARVVFVQLIMEETERAVNRLTPQEANRLREKLLVTTKEVYAAKGIDFVEARQHMLDELNKMGFTVELTGDAPHTLGTLANAQEEIEATLATTDAPDSPTDDTESIPTDELPPDATALDH